MKRCWILLTVIFSFFVLNSMGFGQEEKTEEPPMGWSKEVVGNFNLTQSRFDNWSQGGENSWAWLLNFNLGTEYHKPDWHWSNTGKIEFGRTEVGDQESKKLADEIFLESKYARKFKWEVNPYIALSGRTQLASGFNFETDPKTEISKFLNPAYFIESAGFEYVKEKKFSSRLGIAGKQTVVTDEVFALRYTDDKDTPEIEKLRSEFGLESVSFYSKKVTGIIIYNTTLELFANMKRFDEVDVRWDNLLSAEVAKYITVSFNLQIYYDKDISIQRQLKQILAVGFTYKLF